MLLLSEVSLPEASTLFLKYNYIEVKDLCKHFLTVVTAVLVFSLTFSEKIVDYKNAGPLARVLLLVSWVLFFVSIIACGIALVFNSLAGGIAVYGGDLGIQFMRLAALCANGLIAAAGFSFILGLLSLMATGFVALISKQPEPPKATEAQIVSESMSLHQASGKRPEQFEDYAPNPGHQADG